ncbi:MarR family winged helix-turn-helix transcriptional regulator [Streptomyces turgidiscabies]|uniref:MarR family winged helix-turn-helix transcriptional regulator n=1 Tax=Streptomyces turgidiscabies TaxID=85558 RepID=UPI0038F6209F
MNDPPSEHDAEAMINALLTVTSVLMSISAQAIKRVEESMTVPQFRCLAMLGSKGPISLSDLATVLSVNPSTAMRMADKLADANFVLRDAPKDPGHGTHYVLTAKGEDVVRTALEYRRIEFQRILTKVHAPHRERLVTALEAFADAAGDAMPSLPPL